MGAISRLAVAGTLAFLQAGTFTVDDSGMGPPPVVNKASPSDLQQKLQSIDRQLKVLDRQIDQLERRIPPPNIEKTQR